MCMLNATMVEKPEGLSLSVTNLIARLQALCAESRRLHIESQVFRDSIFDICFDRAPLPLQPPVLNFPVVALLASAGGLLPLCETLAAFPPEFPAAVIVLLHRTAHSHLDEYLCSRVRMPVTVAQHGQHLRSGIVFIAPTLRHITVDSRGRVCLDDGPHVAFAKPAGDLLLQSLAAVFCERVIGVIYSGCGSDGTIGTRAIRETGGVVIAQSAASSRYPDMPVSAVDIGKVDMILPADRIAAAVRVLVRDYQIG